MINDAVEAVLAEIFGQRNGWGNEQVHFKLSPGFEDIRLFAELLTKDTSEEDLHVFLKTQPQFLLGLLGTGQDSDIAFLTKPKIGINYIADFAILSSNQGGCAIHLVEIENVTDTLFTKSLTPSRKLQAAIGQVTDWKQWISVNKPTFVKDMMEISKGAQSYSQGITNGSVRFRTPNEMEETWRYFHGYDHPHITYTIIIGRTSKLTEKEREKLIFLNTQEQKSYTVFTYDALVRKSYSRPMRQLY